MRRVLPGLTVLTLLLALAGAGAAAQRKAPAKPAQPKPSATKPKPAAQRPATAAAKPATSEEAQRAELEEIARLAPAERVERLRAWVRANPRSPFLVRGQELLASARAALGDERLRSSDRAGAVTLFREAVTGAPAAMSEELFFKVLAQLPANLFLLGEREAAVELAGLVEERARGSAQRLLSVAAFYLSIERPDEAARVASAAAQLQPDLAAAHQALGAAHRVGLRLEEAAAAYARALELDPKSASSRRSLADLRRATGKSEEALALYREQLAADPADAGARAGLVLALFDAGRRAEAERELEAALMEQSGNLPLLVGAAYWYAARGEGARALELSQRAVDLEPRYRWVWARVAHARALMAAGRPLEAEQFLRAARELGSFPTLDYELAGALASAGLYEEAAEELARSFAVRDGQLETRLAGRVERRAADFEELLAPERRAGLFQFKGADGEEKAKQLKALLTFHLATRPDALDERQAAEAAREFGAGDDAMRAYRNLYVAGRLLQRGGAARTALERTEAAIPGVEAALDVPVAPFALFADEARELRARARELNTPVRTPEAPREQLSKFMRGRIEELIGWSLYTQGQTAEAVVRLRRAVGVLPENSSWWRSAEWRLGAALEASGSPREALAAYVKAFRVAPDPTRYAVIETLYKKLNRGSAEGLDALLAPPAEAAAAARRTTAPPSITTTPNEPATTTAAPAAIYPAPSTGGTSAAAPAPTTTTPESSPLTAAPAPSIATPEPTPAAVPTPEATPAPSPEATPTPEVTPLTTPTPSREPAPATSETPAPEPASTPDPSPTPATPEPAATPEPTPTPAAEPTPAATPSPARSSPAAAPETADPSPEARARGRRARATAGTCTLSLSESAVNLKPDGGSATVTLSAENYSGLGPPRISPSTPNWADIIILAEPRAPADGPAARFTITSVSRKTGAFVVNFASPCGKQQLAVNVQ